MNEPVKECPKPVHFIESGTGHSPRARPPEGGTGCDSFKVEAEPASESTRRTKRPERTTSQICFSDVRS